LYAYNGAIYFSATNSLGNEPWKTNGTTSGTEMVKDIIPGITSSVPFGFLAAGPTLFFTAWDGVFQSALWKTDGTAAGTVVVKDIFTGLSGYASSSRFSLNGKLVFVG